MYTNVNKEVIQDNTPYTGLDGTKYPANYPKSEIAELSKITEVVRPADNGLDIITGFHIDSTNTQVFDTRPKTQQELDDELKGKARIELYSSDQTMNRILEAIIEGLNTLTSPDVIAYSQYRKDLREVIRGNLTTLPIAPAYPQGT